MHGTQRPAGKVAIDLGLAQTGGPAPLDLEELLSTRLLVQGNSGSGKSHLLRRLLEQSAGAVQQAIIDPEGDFVTLAERFGHVVVDGERTPSDLARIALRIRQHRASVVLNLEGLDAEAQMRCAAAFLGGLFDIDRAYWFPMLVVVDEAQLFAPAVAGEVADDARKASLSAMTNLMCRGRKRGLAGVIATQRLAKLAKNVAAEASNFLMGRTFLDIDMARAADLLGLERRQAESFRDLNPGEFVALGPAVSRRPLRVRIGTVETGTRGGRPTLMAMPEASEAEMRELIFANAAPEPPLEPARREPAAATEALIEAVGSAPAPAPLPAAEAVPSALDEEREAAFDAILAGFVADPEMAFRSPSQLYQDFLVHCRVRRLGSSLLDLQSFSRRLAVARAGVAGGENDAFGEAVAASRELPEDMQGVFLLLARAALDKEPCPSDASLARAYGSRSPSRARRLLTFMEERRLIALEFDFRGNRVVRIPRFGWQSGPGHPKSDDEASGYAA
jgi:hypothetical protein